MNKLRLIVGGLDVRLESHGCDDDGPLITSQVRCTRGGRTYRGTLDDVIYRHEVPAEGPTPPHPVPASIADSLDLWSRRYAF